MTILLDIGNTNIAYSYGGDALHSISSNAFIQNIKNFINSKTESIIFASVVPSISRILIEEGQKQKIFYKEITLEDIPMQINIKNKEELGMDRAVNAFMALQKYKTNCIVVDFGTALTFDIVHNESYQGGMIFPGLAMAMHNLHTKTAKLPDVKIHTLGNGIGKTTIEAITFGACIGYSGVLKETIAFICKHYNCDFKIIFTGGSGKMFSNTVDGSIFEDNLIIQFLSTFTTKHH